MNNEVYVMAAKPVLIELLSEEKEIKELLQGKGGKHRINLNSEFGIHYYKNILNDIQKKFKNIYEHVLSDFERGKLKRIYDLNFKDITSGNVDLIIEECNGYLSQN